MVVQTGTTVSSGRVPQYNIPGWTDQLIDSYLRGLEGGIGGWEAKSFLAAVAAGTWSTREAGQAAIKGVAKPGMTLSQLREAIQEPIAPVPSYTYEPPEGPGNEWFDWEDEDT